MAFDKNLVPFLRDKGMLLTDDCKALPGSTLEWSDSNSTRTFVWQGDPEAVKNMLLDQLERAGLTVRSSKVEVTEVEGTRAIRFED